MNWNQLTTVEQIDAIKTASLQKPQVIFKHSRTCSISGMALNRLERSNAPAGADFHYLDLLAFRQVSNAIAEAFQVHHESPQVLVIKNGECTYDESHYGINMDEIVEQVG